MSSAASDIRTRLLIISDTHGKCPFNPSTHPKQAQRYGFRLPLPKADVAIHCGDLTIRSDVKEYESTFNIMRDIDAPLKLVIPGNHDLSMDADMWDKECTRRSRFRSAEAVDRLRKQPQDTYKVVEKARQDGIHVLVAEGTYHFVLANGAKLTVYATPWTPRYGSWAFQYDPDVMEVEGGDAPIGGHEFKVPEGVDIALTHGPPYGILDRTRRGANHAGCRGLLAAVRKARPRVHCFGHIHEGYGALLMPWEDKDKKVMVKGPVIADNADVKPLSLCPQDQETLCSVPGEHTLFVNAAIMDLHYQPSQSPWLVDLGLPSADEEHAVKAEQTQEVLSVPINAENAKSRTRERIVS